MGAPVIHGEFQVILCGGAVPFLPTFGSNSAIIPSTIIPKERGVVRLTYFQKSTAELQKFAI